MRNWGFYLMIAAVGLASWAGIIEDRTAYAIMIIAFGITLSIGISEWEQRSKETHDQIVELNAEMQRVKEATLNIESQVERMSRQMSQWQ